jgi:TetR/AcrR family transcriptional regulator
MTAGDTANRRKILKHAIRLFALKGFAATSVREIAKEVGTTVPNIYYYFGSKEELYSHIIETTVEDFSLAIRKAAEVETKLAHQLAAMTIAKYKFIDKNPQRMRIFFREWFAPENEAAQREQGKPDFTQALGTMIYMVRDKIAHGEIQDVNPEHAAWVLVGVFNAFDLGFINLGTTPSDEEIKSVVKMALAGIEN